MATKVIPFDLETAKKIQAGEIKGIIRTWAGNPVKKMAIFDIDRTYPIYCDICGVLHSYTKDGKERAWGTGYWAFDLYIELEVPNEPQFKPFDKVLVRDQNGYIWRADIFSHMSVSGGGYVCIGTMWKQCIPFEGNEYLLGTTDKPKED